MCQREKGEGRKASVRRAKGEGRREKREARSEKGEGRREKGFFLCVQSFCVLCVKASVCKSACV